MMDEVWSRGWAQAHKAALQARQATVRSGQPVPTLWSELRMLLRDLVTPPARKDVEEASCDHPTCQSAA